MNVLKRLITEEEGQGLIEYVLIIALIAVVCIGVLRTIGQRTGAQLTDVETALE